MRNSGFTLAEILVAFVILGLSLASAYAAFSGGLRAERRAGESLEAFTRHWTARFQEDNESIDGGPLE